MPVSILIVDDDDGVRSMLKLAFQAHSYQVQTASSAAEAAAMLAAQTFDVVLTDMKMETDTAGFDVVRAAIVQPDPPPTIVLTAYPVLAQEWHEVGATAVLQKPVAMATLFSVIEDVVNTRRRRAGTS